MHWGFASLVSLAMSLCFYVIFVLDGERMRRLWWQLGITCDEGVIRVIVRASIKGIGRGRDRKEEIL